MTSTTASRLRTRAGLVLAAAGVLLIAACGIDSDALGIVDSGPVSTIGSSATTTTRADDPGFTLPTIAPGDPDTTTTTSEPTTSETSDTAGPPETPDTAGPATTDDSQVTPHGRTPDTVRPLLESLLPASVPDEVVDCLADVLFDEFTGAEVDEILEAQSMATIDPELAGRFLAVAATCSAGG